MTGLKGFCRRAIGDESGNGVLLTAMSLIYFRALSEQCLKTGHDRSRTARGPMNDNGLWPRRGGSICSLNDY
jgi:hypothetical protein